MRKTVLFASLAAIVVIVGFVLLGVAFENASFGGIAAIIAAVAFGAAMLGLMSLLLTLVGTVRELTSTVRQLTDQAVPILAGLSETVSGVNTELARVDAIVGSVQHISNQATGVADIVHTAVANPLIKAIAFATGTRVAVKAAKKVD
jgi:methyl-accepting chemotaxis protein